MHDAFDASEMQHNLLQRFSVLSLSKFIHDLWEFLNNPIYIKHKSEVSEGKTCSDSSLLEGSDESEGSATGIKTYCYFYLLFL